MTRVGGAPKRTILVVDDDPGILEGLRLALSPRYRVLTAGSTPDALQVFREKGVDLLIADIKMPGPDGVALVREIRLVDLKVPILVITAHPEPPKTEALATEGIAGYFRKPFSLTLLSDRVHRLLESLPPSPAIPARTSPLPPESPPSGSRLFQQLGHTVASDERVDRVMDFLATNYHRRIRLEELLSAARCSHTTLTRLFRERVHVSPMQFVTRLRVRRAYQLLIETDLPFARVCALVGLRHVHHAHTFFRQVTGMNPPEFRQMCRELVFEPAVTRILSTLCENARRTLGLDGAYLFVLQAEDLIGVGSAGHNAHLFTGLRIPVADPKSISARVIREGRTVVHADVASSEDGDVTDVTMFRTGAGVWRGLASADRQVGVAVFTSYAPRVFSPEELSRVDAFSRNMVRKLSILA